jgi:hypothetical protein
MAKPVTTTVKWNELSYFDALPVASEPEYSAGFTCDVCGVEYAVGPFYHNSKKGRDACLRCAVEAGVHYLPGAVCSLLLPPATVELIAPPGPRVLCALQFTTESFAVVLTDSTAVTLYGKDPLHSGFTSALVNSAQVKRGRDGQLSRPMLVDASRSAVSVSFSEAVRRYPALKPMTGPAAMAPVAKLFPTVVELCSPLQPPPAGTAGAPPCVLWHNLGSSDALTKPEPNSEADDVWEDCAPSAQLFLMIVSRVLHVWHPHSGLELLIDFSSQLVGPPLASGAGAAAVRHALENSVRGVFRYGYAVINWREDLRASQAKDAPVGRMVIDILDRLSQILPWSS